MTHTTVTIEWNGVRYDVIGHDHKASAGTRRDPPEHAFFEIERVCYAGSRVNVMHLLDEEALDEMAQEAHETCNPEPEYEPDEEESHENH